MNIEWIEIPSGEFVQGTAESEVEHLCQEYGTVWFTKELPQQVVFLDSFVISKFPVTNAQYKEFVDATGYEIRSSPYFHKYQLGDSDLANHPIAWVSWYDANAFCQWMQCRLPTRAEWEKAARGSTGFKYPWGNNWEEGRCNSAEAGIKMTTPVGAYPQGASIYGLQDMAGNVWEWTDDWITTDIIPGKWLVEGVQQSSETNQTKVTRDEKLTNAWQFPVLRGGAANTNSVSVRSAFRFAKYLPYDWGDWVGFRCVGRTTSKTRYF
jgi:formylglycine-generating enzyme required for sulfatase activity